MREAGGCSELEMPGNCAFSETKVHTGVEEARWLNVSVRPRAGPKLPKATLLCLDIYAWVS